MFVLMTLPALSPAFAKSESPWPKEIKPPEGRILIYQPQPDEQDGDILTGRAAVSITLKGKTEPVFGTVWMRARMNVDKENRTVEFFDVTVTKSRFPGSTPEREQRLAAIIEAEFPKWDLTESLDRLIATLAIVEKEKSYAAAFNTKPPKIFVEKIPAILVIIDGEPVLRKVEGLEGVQRVVNTPFFIAYDGKDYYLNGGADWFSAKDLFGEWKSEKGPSKEVLEFYKKAGGQKEQQAPRPQASSTQPTEPSKPKGNAKPPRFWSQGASRVDRHRGRAEVPPCNGHRPSVCDQHR
jgi:hypothetical protein